MAENKDEQLTDEELAQLQLAEENENAVDRLVQEGLLVRREVAHDRRKVELELTEKAAPIVEKGRAVQKQFIDTMLQGIDETTLAAFRTALMQMEKNIKNTEA